MRERVPDKQDIEEVFTQYQGQWSECHAKWKQIDSFIWQTYNVWPDITEKRGAYRPSKAASLVDHAADNQMPYDPMFRRHLNEGGAEQEDEKTASLVENFLAAAFDEMQRRAMTMQFKTAGRYLCAYGYAVLEGPLLDWASRPVEPRREKGEDDDEFEARVAQWKAEQRMWMPFILEAPHPIRVLLDPMEKRPSYAVKLVHIRERDLEALSIRKARTRRMATRYVRPSGASPLDSRLTKEYWSKDWHALLVDGAEVLFVERNTIGYVPFDHGYAGFSQERSDRDMFNPADLAVGVIDRVMEGIRVYAQALSAHHQLLIDSAYAPRGTTQAAEEAAQAIGTGKLLEGRAEDYWVLKPPELNQAIMATSAEAKQDIEEGSYAVHLSGVRPEGVSTVGQQQQLTTLAIKKFVAPARTLESMATTVAQRILQLVLVLREPVTIHGIRLHPSALKYDTTVEVKFELLDPVLDLQMKNIGMREVQLGLISPVDYRRRYGHIEDEHTAYKNLIKHRISQMPAVAAIEEQAVAKEMGLEDVYDAMKAAQAQAEAEAQAEAQGQGQGGGANIPPPRQPLGPGIAKPAPVVRGGTA